MDSVIKINNVSKSFKIPDRKTNSITELFTSPFKQRHYKTLEVLKNISIDIKKGEFVGIMGKNGSGKSTLLKILAQIYNPSSGVIEIKGKVVPFLELGVGFNPELTGKQNVFFNGSILGMRQTFLKQKLDKIFEFAELEDFKDVPLKNYSSGMQVRLAFSIAIMTNADIYILDEVLAVGDISFKKKCLNIFKEFKKKGKTIVLVSHSPEEIKRFCTTAYYLENGELIKGKSVSEVINKYIKSE